jgi:hypothetical protein
LQGAAFPEETERTVRRSFSFRLAERLHHALKTRVLRGEVQVGFGVMSVFDRDLYVVPILNEGFSLCIPDSHHLRNKVRVAVHDVVNEKLHWIWRFMHPTFCDRVTCYLQGVGCELRNLNEAGGIVEGIDFAAYKSGVALVQQSASRF